MKQPLRHSWLIATVFLTQTASAIEANGDMEWLFAEGLSYRSTLLSLGDNIDSLEWKLDLNAQRTEIDYLPTGFPVDIVTEPESRAESYFFLSNEWIIPLNARIQLRTRAYWSGGWGTHQDIWLDEYYRQVWQDSPVPGDRYASPDPYAAGGDVGVTWEFKPSSAFLNASIGYTRRVIAPGYDFSVEGERSGQLVRGIRNIEDLRFDLSLDTVVNAWLRMQNGITMVDATARDPRMSIKSAGNIALGDHWILRISALYAREATEFDAHHLQMQWIRDIGYQWSLYAALGTYRDSGEIEQANLATDAAPALESLDWSLGCIWRAEDGSRSFHVSFGKYQHTYDNRQIDRRFANLYANRDWTLIKVGYQHQF